MTMFWEIVRFVLLKIENFREKIAFQLALLENKGKPVTRIIQGSRMKIDLTDPGISRELLIDKIREESSTKEFIKKMKKGMIIADIGANLGYYALMEAKHIGTEGKVYAFEPVPANVKLLMESIELNNYKNVEIVEKAAGEKEGIVEFNLANKSNAGSLYALDEKQFKKKLTVEMTTLDSFFRNKKAPDFVRMDVQGAELDVLKGMSKLLKTKKLSLFIEVHSGILGKDKKIELLKLLEHNGFTKIKVIKELPIKFKRISKFVPAKFMPIEEQKYNADIQEILKNPPKGWFHIFAEKGGL